MYTYCNLHEYPYAYPGIQKERVPGYPGFVRSYTNAGRSNYPLGVPTRGIFNTRVPTGTRYPPGYVWKLESPLPGCPGCRDCLRMLSRYPGYRCPRPRIDVVLHSQELKRCGCKRRLVTRGAAR
eukprot:2222467-Rhodomonas_salina.2